MRNLAITLLAIGFAAFASAKTVWSYNTETGRQQYVRTILGIEVAALSEYGYHECSNWKKANSPSKDNVVIKECWLLFGCSVNAQNNAVFSQSCGNT